MSSEKEGSINMCSGQKEPDTRAHRAAKQLIQTSRIQMSYVESQVRRTGVYRSQHQILMYIAANPNASQKDIARMHQVSTATIAVTLKKLEKAGYIRRAADAEDNRCNRIQMTEKGEAVVSQSCQIFRQIEEKMFAGFEEEDFRRFEELMERICGNLQIGHGSLAGCSCDLAGKDKK